MTTIQVGDRVADRPPESKPLQSAIGYFNEAPFGYVSHQGKETLT